MKNKLFKTPLSIVTAWMEGVNKKSADKVAALYHERSSLLPTFSPHALHTKKERLYYFKTLASRKGLKVSLHRKTVQTLEISSDHWVASGIYRFAFEIDSEPLIFEARFTMVIDLSNPHPILHHHSSQLPRTLG